MAPLAVQADAALRQRSTVQGAWVDYMSVAILSSFVVLVAAVLHGGARALHGTQHVCGSCAGWWLMRRAAPACTPPTAHRHRRSTHAVTIEALTARFSPRFHLHAPAPKLLLLALAGVLPPLLHAATRVLSSVYGATATSIRPALAAFIPAALIGLATLAYFLGYSVWGYRGPVLGVRKVWRRVRRRKGLVKAGVAHGGGGEAQPRGGVGVEGQADEGSEGEEEWEEVEEEFEEMEEGEGWAEQEEAPMEVISYVHHPLAMAYMAPPLPRKAQQEIEAALAAKVRLQRGVRGLLAPAGDWRTHAHLPRCSCGTSAHAMIHSMDLI